MTKMCGLRNGLWAYKEVKDLSLTDFLKFQIRCIFNIIT